MQFAKLTKSIWLVLLANTLDAFAEGNVCQDKYWLQSPIVEAKSSDGSGIGGTGVSLPVKSDVLAQRNGEGESGIGGTGIVGVISGFGSICVNGIEIHYDSKIPIVEDGVLTDFNRLALGQTVSILATSITQNYYAKEIHVLHEVQGVVESVDSNNGVFNVLGQTVHLPENLLDKITVGDNVVISGNRLTDGSIEAARVEKHDVINHVSLIGTLEVDNSSGNFRIGNQSIEFPKNHTDVKIGDEVRIQGILNDKILRVEKLEQNPRWSFPARVEQLLLQGYVRESTKAQINIDGVKINVKETTDKTPKIGEHTGIWVHENGKGRMVFDHLDTGNMLPEHNHRNGFHDSLKKESMSFQPNYEHEHAEHNSEFRESSAMKPEINHIDMDDKPTIIHPEINHPDIDKPAVMQQEINHPDIDKPTVIRPEINHPDIDKPAVIRPEINRPDVHERSEQLNR